ncbi:MAG: acyl-homoserine-lactone acylase [Aliidongia sp.]|nr:acyl-homoserine-lactone acylase [Aliidongia sp.]
MRILGRGALALVALAVIALAGIILVDRLDQPLAVDAPPLLAKAGHYDVRIKRDEFGVPHIIGKRDADVAFGLGFAHAEDDFATIQTVALATRGTLAARDGREAAITDYLVHLFRVWETIDAKYDKELPPDLKLVLEAYADGVNDYAARHPEAAAPGLLPVTGRDIAAGFVFKTPFFYGLDKVLLNLTSPNAGAALSKEGKDAFLPTRNPLPIGSNGVAVAPARAADGATRLLVNSHQPYTGPVAWYEAVLESEEGWHVAGGFFPGTPFMLHGHNEHLGWANTVNNPDLVDVYQLTLNPQNENQYRLDGQWRDFEKSDAKLRVKIWGPLIWTVHRDVLYSAHGPVLKTDHGAFAIRYAGMGEVRQALQYYRLDKARDLAEWRAAMALQALPSINYIYADERGNIGYVYNGQFPIRHEGVDWSGVLPGDRSDLIWHGYLPFDQIPQLWNPPSGFVFNSNNTPFQATAPEDDLKPQDYSARLGIQTNMTNRAWRALETFGTDPAITEEAFRRDKFDLAYSKRSRMAAIIAEVVAIDPGADRDLKQAQEFLRQWDRKTDQANPAAALAILTGEPIVHAEIEGQPVPKPIDTLQAAIKSLKSHFGRLDPRWSAAAPSIYRSMAAPIRFARSMGRRNPMGRGRQMAAIRSSCSSPGTNPALLDPKASINSARPHLIPARPILPIKRPSSMP